MGGVREVAVGGAVFAVVRHDGAARGSRSWMVMRDGAAERLHEFRLEGAGAELRFRIPAERFGTAYDHRLEVVTAAAPGGAPTALLMRNLTTGLELDLGAEAEGLLRPALAPLRRAALAAALAGPPLAAAGYGAASAALAAPLLLLAWAAALGLLLLAGLRRRRGLAALADAVRGLAAGRRAEAEADAAWSATDPEGPTPDEAFILDDDALWDGPADAGWADAGGADAGEVYAEFSPVEPEGPAALAAARPLPALAGPGRGLPALREVAAGLPALLSDDVPDFVEVEPRRWRSADGTEIAARPGGILLCRLPGRAPIGLLVGIEGRALRVRGGRVRDARHGVRGLDAAERALLGPVAEGYARRLGLGLRLPESWVAAVRDAGMGEGRAA
ncbi:MAG TPA: hypothetical protein VEH84_09450 [Alphaproteobacteria bacterium]|nr:hypothetical protein [Alphaproteobacteria bacterium]